MSTSNATAITRRQLFRGDFHGGKAPFRPPWSVSEEAFAGACDRCGDCLRACGERVIRVGSGGYPEMDFSSGGCSLCGDCVTACEGKALTGQPETDRPWALVAEIGDSCLANQGVVCRTCGEACDEGAVRFQLRVGGAAAPLLDAGRCTGCGSCVSVCPVRALRVTRPRAVSTEKTLA